MMNVLLIGSGGREHALAWKIRQSPQLGNLFIAPGNAGTAALGKNIKLSVSDFDAIKKAALDHAIGMLVVGPEVPLVDGIHDYFMNDPDLSHIPVIGPVKQAAKLEGSKEFAKAFMQRHGIPTAKYGSFTQHEMNGALAFLKTMSSPYVLKADGLAAGKGVLICSTFEEAKNELESMLLHSKFGQAGEKVIIEEYLQGIEMSAFTLTDGKNYLVLPSAKDYKRVGEGDTGPNTGGMGSISPVPFADKNFMDKVEEKIIAPTHQGLIREGIDYRGFIFFGLMNVGGEPYVIEYNVRMGDPEAESVIPRIKNDLLELFIGVSKQNLDSYTIETDPAYTATVMLVSSGYPGDYQKNKAISGLEDIHDCLLFHAGTTFAADGKEIVSSGGRVIAVTSAAHSLEEAFAKSYLYAERIKFENKAYRKDLGKDLMKYFS